MICVSDQSPSGTNIFFETVVVVFLLVWRQWCADDDGEKDGGQKLKDTY
jgi:hypothetical protein